MNKVWSEFREFITHSKVVDLAVGIVVGSAFTGIVNSFVNDVVMPPIGWLMGGIDFSDYFFAFSTKDYPTLAAAKRAGVATINYGIFINAIIKFALIAIAVFILVKQFNRLRHDKKTTESLLEDIRNILRDQNEKKPDKHG